MPTISPVDFIASCERRGIVLSLVPGDPPRVKVRADSPIPPKVGDTIKAHKAAIVLVLLGTSTKQIEIERCNPTPKVDLPVDDPLSSDLEELGRIADEEINVTALPDEPVFSVDLSSFYGLLESAWENLLPCVLVRLTKGATVADPNAFVRSCFSRADVARVRLLADLSDAERRRCEESLRQIEVHLSIVQNVLSSTVEVEISN